MEKTFTGEDVVPAQDPAQLLRDAGVYTDRRLDNSAPRRIHHHAPKHMVSKEQLKATGMA